MHVSFNFLNMNNTNKRTFSTHDNYDINITITSYMKYVNRLIFFLKNVTVTVKSAKIKYSRTTLQTLAIRSKYSDRFKYGAAKNKIFKIL